MLRLRRRLANPEFVFGAEHFLQVLLHVGCQVWCGTRLLGCGKGTDVHSRFGRGNGDRGQGLEVLGWGRAAVTDDPGVCEGLAGSVASVRVQDEEFSDKVLG